MKILQFTFQPLAWTGHKHGDEKENEAERLLKSSSEGEEIRQLSNGEGIVLNLLEALIDKCCTRVITIFLQYRQHMEHS